MAHVEYTWTQHHAEVEVRVALGAAVRKHEVTVTVRPWLLSVEVAGRGVVLRGSLHRAVVSAESVWVLEEGELMLMLAKSDKVLWSRLFPQEERLAPTAAIKSVYEDDDDEGRLSYLELSPEARSLPLPLPLPPPTPYPYHYPYPTPTPTPTPYPNQARSLVDLHRDHRHARATGKDAWAAELEEEMKMMRFRWGEPEDEQLS